MRCRGSAGLGKVRAEEARQLAWGLVQKFRQKMMATWSRWSNNGGDEKQQGSRYSLKSQDLLASIYVI